MKYNMFIDDERYPPMGDGNLWVICRNKTDVQWYVESQGFPSFISFDHDLGEDQPTGLDIAAYLVDLDIDSNDSDDTTYGNLVDCAFYVHSQNPIGKANIEGLLNGYFKFCKKEANE